MKKAIVTGHRGFVGTNLRNHLENNGYIVEGFDEEIFSFRNLKVELVSLIKSMEPDVIFHVGACSNTLENRVQFMMERNFEVTKIIAEICDELVIPMIYSSSAASYGVNDIFPANLYGWSKYAGESFVSAMGGISLRYFNVYGPGEENKGRMASFFFQAWKNQELGIESELFPGNPKRDFIYIEDIIDANIQALSTFSANKGGVFDVGTASARTFEEALQVLKIPFRYADSSVIPVGYQNYTCADRAKWLPGWAPKFTLENGLRTYVDYLKKLNF